MRRALIGLTAGLVSAVGFVLVFGLMVFLNAGYVYRVDCLTTEGTVKRSWTWDPLLVLPYILPPEQPGCEANAAGEVGLARIGLGRAERLAASPLTGADRINAELNIYADRLLAAMTRYFNTPEGADEDTVLAAGAALRTALNALEPPHNYAQLNTDLVDSFEQSWHDFELGLSAQRLGQDAASRRHFAASLEAHADFMAAFEAIRAKADPG